LLQFLKAKIMLDKLTSMFSETVKDQLEDKIMESIGMDADKADKTVKVGTETILSGFTDELMSGNVSGLTDLVKGGTQNVAQNSIVSNISQKVVSALAEQVGLSQSMANKAVEIIIPFVMNMLNEKDADDSPFSLDSMFDLLSGKKDENDADDLFSGLSKGLGGLFG
jgi:uncharacterized protein YidB (DUF937 family)